jgi:hypothetical protein
MKMAYLKEAKQELEIDFPLSSVWEAIPKAVNELGWKIQEQDKTTHRLIVNTKGTLTAYGSQLKMQLSKANEKTTNLAIIGETPATTITSTLNFTATPESIDIFSITLAKIMNE